MRRLAGNLRQRGVCRACRAFEATAGAGGEKLCWVCAHMVEVHSKPVREAAHWHCGCRPEEIYPADVRVGLLPSPEPNASAGGDRHRDHQHALPAHPAA